MRIDKRIDKALNGHVMEYHCLARLVFPEKDYPRAWRYSQNGGPPGCYMALSAAIRRYEFGDFPNYEKERIIYPRKLLHVPVSDDEN